MEFYIFTSYMVSAWVCFALPGCGAEVESAPTLFYLNNLCARQYNLAINDRKAIRISPWNPPGLVPSMKTCVVPVWSHRYQNYMLTTTFKTMDMSKASPSGQCYTARLDLYNGNTTSPFSLISGNYGLCGKQDIKRAYSTTRNIMTMKFTTGTYSRYKYEYFEAVITPYHTGHCADDEIRCKNGRCIYRDLLCDGYNNCGDDSDELNCKKLLLSIAAIIGIVVGCVVVIGIIVTIVICKCCCAVCGYERL